MLYLDNSIRLVTAWVLLVLLALSGCGGSSNGGNNKPNTTTTTTVQKTTTTTKPATTTSTVVTTTTTTTLFEISGVNFGPYMDGQDPNRGTVIGENQIRQRLSIINGYTNCVRTFGVGSGLQHIPRIAQEMGFCVAAGAWLDKNLSTNEIEIKSLIEIGLAGQAEILIVGSEVLYRKDLTEAQLVDYINRVKSAVPGVIVTTGEVYDILLAHPKVIDVVDVVFANHYPYWEGIVLSNAVAALHVYHQSIVNIANGKEVMISETGWPSCGGTQGNAISSIENASDYFINFVSWAKANHVRYFYFEAFDEAWKAAYEGPPGACWGIWNKDGVLKSGMQRVFDGKTVSDNWSGGVYIPGGIGEPSIELTYVPPIGSEENLVGKVLHVLPSDYRVVVYIKVGFWWIKPTIANPRTSIALDGTWITDITTGGADYLASHVAAFLVRSDYTPPILLGADELPETLNENALASVQVIRE